MILLAGAWLFDHFHQGEKSEITATHAAGSGTTSEYPGFYCTPQVAVSLKAPVQKNSQSKFFQEKLNRIIQAQLSARSVFLRKAEVLKQPHSQITSRNLISFRYHFLHYPDDQPPV